MYMGHPGIGMFWWFLCQVIIPETYGFNADLLCIRGFRVFAWFGGFHAKLLSPKPKASMMKDWELKLQFCSVLNYWTRTWLSLNKFHKAQPCSLLIYQDYGVIEP